MTDALKPDWVLVAERDEQLQNQLASLPVVEPAAPLQLLPNYNYPVRQPVDSHEYVTSGVGARLARGFELLDDSGE